MAQNLLIKTDFEDVLYISKILLVKNVNLSKVSPTTIDPFLEKIEKMDSSFYSEISIISIFFHKLANLKRL